MKIDEIRKTLTDISCICEGVVDPVWCHKCVSSFLLSRIEELERELKGLSFWREVQKTLRGGEG